jgi:hypothetical protein
VRDAETLADAPRTLGSVAVNNTGRQGFSAVTTARRARAAISDHVNC